MPHLWTAAEGSVRIAGLSGLLAQVPPARNALLRRTPPGGGPSPVEKKFESGEVFEAEVKDVVKGGLVVDLGVRGFVPASLVEDYFVEDFSDYKNRALTFKIVELEKDKNRLILSHRAVIQEEKQKEKANCTR